MHHVVEHRPSSAPQHDQIAQRRAQDHRRNRDPRAETDFLSFVLVLALRFGILHGKLYELQLGKLNLGGQ